MEMCTKQGWSSHWCAHPPSGLRLQAQVSKLVRTKCLRAATRGTLLAALSACGLPVFGSGSVSFMRAGALGTC